jgi:diketogulonate reductase-like aldo/keto reductase
MEHVTLRNGERIPQLGLGTWELTGDECSRSVAAALEMGYRHVDTAFAYGNHREVGEGIKTSGVPRHDIFLTTKITLGKQSRSQVIQHGQKLQDELQTDYVDLLLIHWPDKNVEFSETLGAMNELIKKGIVKGVGVSNFNKRIVAEAEEASPAPVLTNQVEFHPLLYQRELMETCKGLGITITAYSPLARGEVIKDDRIKTIAESHGATPAQVALSWLLGKGIIAIPKASSREHLQENMDAVAVKLTPEEERTVDAIDANKRVVDGPWKHYPLE